MPVSYLGFSRIETEDLLSARLALYDYSLEELDREADLVRSLRHRS